MSKTDIDVYKRREIQTKQKVIRKQNAKSRDLELQA
jgi:hypothetical protein